MSTAPDTNRPIAVFDFDRTLINTDVAYQFLDTGIKRSKFRRITFGMLMPLLVPLLLMQRCRIVAMSVIMWLATFPLHGKSVQDVFNGVFNLVLAFFINYYLVGGRNLTFFLGSLMVYAVAQIVFAVFYWRYPE